jgi:hypothetical protein
MSHLDFELFEWLGQKIGCRRLRPESAERECDSTPLDRLGVGHVIGPFQISINDGFLIKRRRMWHFIQRATGFDRVALVFVSCYPSLVSVPLHSSWSLLFWVQVFLLPAF